MHFVALTLVYFVLSQHDLERKSSFLDIPKSEDDFFLHYICFLMSAINISFW